MEYCTRRWILFMAVLEAILLILEFKQLIPLPVHTNHSLILTHFRTCHSPTIQLLLLGSFPASVFTWFSTWSHSCSPFPPISDVSDTHVPTESQKVFRRQQTAAHYMMRVIWFDIMMQIEKQLMPLCIGSVTLLSIRVSLSFTVHLIRQQRTTENPLIL